MRSSQTFSPLLLVLTLTLVSDAPGAAQPMPASPLALLPGPVVLVDPGQESTATPDLVAAEGRFLIAWERQRPEQPSIHPPSPAGEAIAFRWIDADGSFPDEPVELQRVASPTILASPRVSVDDGGNALVAWTTRPPTHAPCIEWASAGEASPIFGGDVPCEAVGFPEAFELSGGPAGHSLVYVETEVILGPGLTDERYEHFPAVLSLGSEGAKEGPPVRLAEDPSSLAGVGSAHGEGGVVVAWQDGDPDARIAFVTGAVLGPEGASAPSRIFEAVFPSPASKVASPTVAEVPHGPALVAWVEPFSHAFLVRRVGPDGPVGQTLRFEAPEDVFLARPAVATGPGGAFALAWRQFDQAAEEASCRLAVFDPVGRKLGEEVILETDCRTPVVAWSGASIATAWSTATSGRLREVRSQVFAVEGALPPPVPDAPATTAPDFPGFRFWVRITGGGGEIPGTEVGSCIPEAACFAGALPDRTEVIVRIVGPKPNGFLWPTLVKLTTSRVEVWIEQEATGIVRYYELEGAAPGVDELPGLFDRHGFRP